MLELVGQSNFLISEFKLEIKKSKFITYIYKVENQEDINSILDEIKKNNKEAKHIVYAYRLKNTGKFTDDKEPSGTAGKPIYAALDKENIVNILVVVVRYFGGILLGTGPLMRAYLHGYLEAIKKCELQNYVEYISKKYVIEYSQLKEITREINKKNGIIVNIANGEKIEIIAKIPFSENY